LRKGQHRRIFPSKWAVSKEAKRKIQSVRSDYDFNALGHPGKLAGFVTFWWLAVANAFHLLHWLIDFPEPPSNDLIFPFRRNYFDHLAFYPPRE
jgi:hypothetical protein